MVLFKPYYFNHLMAIQMTGGANTVLCGPCDPLSMHPDLDWLQEQMQGPHPPKLVVLVNPCNPTGTSPKCNAPPSWSCWSTPATQRERTP